MPRLLRPCAVFLLAFLALAGAPAHAADSGAARTTAEATAARGVLARAPARFVENVGQFGESAAFVVAGRDKAVLLAPDGVTFALAATPAAAALQPVSLAASTADSTRIRLEFIDANRHVRPVGEAVAPTRFNYLRGDARAWKTGVRSYARVVYPDLWPGIDLVYRGTGDGIKYSFVVHPGADPARIRLAYAGAQSVTIDAGGGLAVATAAGAFGDAAPVSYQQHGAATLAIDTRFVLGATDSARTEFTFAVAAYDPSRELVIDPAVNVMVGFLGGSGLDEINAVAVDAAANVYVTGSTLSTSAFATGGAFQTTLAGGVDAFVAKIGPSGTLAYVTYLGGARDDVANGIAVDSTGAAYITGYTNSADFPHDVQAGDGRFRRTHNATDGDGTGNGADVFVTKLDATGSALVYSGFLGSSGDDVAHAIALDATGAAYVTGDVSSPNCTTSNFPTVTGPVTTFTPSDGPMCMDAFVGKIRADGSGVTYLGFIGGIGGTESGHGIAVNASTGEAYVAGETDSGPGAGFPSTPGSFGSPAGSGYAHAFVVKVNAAGTTFAYAGTLSTNGQDRAFAVAIDGSGNAYIAGDTQASNLATVGVTQTANGGAGDPFAAKITSTGAAVAYATYLGGASADAAKGIVVDSIGVATITGFTPQLGATVASPGLDTTPNGANDAFLVQLNTTATTKQFAGYLGGSADDLGNAVAPGTTAAKFVLAGNSYSGNGSFPVTGVPATGTFSQAYKGTGDGFVAVIGPYGQATHFSVVASPTTVAAGGAVSLVVTALDASNTVVQDYVGTVHFTSTDGAATLPANYTFVPGDAGVHTFSSAATLRTTGAQTITATDTVTATIAGTSNAVTVVPGPATHFVVTAPATAVAGTPFNVTVQARDALGNVATGYVGTVHLTTTDPAGTLPADYTFVAGDNGTHVFALGATLATAGAQTITATDTATATITGTSGTIAVSAGAATQFLVSAPPSAVAGAPFAVTVTARDAFGNTATGYAGTVHFTSTDGAATLPANGTLTNGTAIVSVILRTVGTHTITATDTVTSAITGTSGNVLVAAGAATQFSVVAPANAVAGAAFNYTVTARDAFGNTVPGYAGTVHFTSTDGAATLPADATLTNGTGTFSATLRTAGARTITATDVVAPAITGTSNAIAVAAGAAMRLAVVAPPTATAGAAFNFTVTAQDALGNTATGYAGTVHFTSTDGAVTLPANATLVNGTGTFSATLRTAGTQTITATDTLTAGITGTSNNIAVGAGAATRLTVSAPATASSGAPFNVTVTALDAFDNTATGYAGTVHFTSTDGTATLPANATLTNGTGTFSVTLRTVGTHTVTATDTVTATITGTSGNIAVAAATATHFVVSAPATAVAGVALNYTVTAKDAFENTVTDYAGTVHFTSTDAAATLPANATLTNGTGTFGATLKTVGAQTLAATDTVSASITGTSNAIAVSAGATTRLVVTAPAGAIAGTAFNFTVTARDAFDNTATAYAGTVHFTSTDPAATLPANATLTNGTGTFSATLATVGTRTLTATDTVTTTITGTSGNIVVSAGPPATVVTSAGTPQSATVQAAYGTALAVTVRDSANNPVAGIAVTFTAPATGASVTPATVTVNTDANGVATTPTLTANGVVGAFTVTAAVSGVATPASFTLTNTAWLVYSGTTATGTGIATATLSGGGPTCTYANAALVNVPVPGPPGTSFPDGLFDFTATGCSGSITLTITWPTAFGFATKYWKYGPLPPGPPPKPAQWYTLDASNAVSLAGRTATFTIADGGRGDDDLTVNGTIVDQGGPGGPAPVINTAPVPTLSQWTMALLALLLGTAGALAVRRRRVARPHPRRD